MEITPLICIINPHDAEKIPPKRNVLRCKQLQEVGRDNWRQLTNRSSPLQRVHVIRHHPQAKLTSTAPSAVGLASVCDPLFVLDF